MGRMEIGPLATQRLLLVEPAHSLVDVARRMQGRNVGAALVQAGDGPGIITERDVLRAVSEGVDLTATTVGDYMTSAPVVAAASCDIMQAARMMSRGGFRHLIVTEEGTAVGMLSMRDLLEALVEECDQAELP